MKLKFIALPIAFARWGTILPVVREITRINLEYFFFRIKSGRCKSSIISEIIILYYGNQARIIKIF